jgi:TP901 family phage tail tape measure protein
MADPGVGGNEHINIDVDFHANGAEQATQSVNLFSKAMQTLQRVLAGKSSSGNIFTQTAANARQAQVAVNSAQASVAKFGFAGNAQKDRAGFRAWTKDMHQLGYAIKANPPTFALMAKNVRTVGEAFKDSSKAGLATIGTVQALNGGPPAAFNHTKSLNLFKVQASVARKGIEGITTSMKNAAKNAQWTGRQMIQGISLPIALLGTSALRTYESFNKHMMQLKKITQYKEDYKDLTAQMDKLTLSFGLSSTAAASLFEKIASLGYRGKALGQIAEAVTKVSLASGAGQEDAMLFFRSIAAIYNGGSISKTSEDMAKLSAVTDDTTILFKDLVGSMPLVGPIMKNMGFSASGTAAALSAMTHRGVPATEGANALKFAMTRLVNPTKKSAEVIKQLGISFFDASGKASDGTQNLAAMAMALEGLSDKGKLSALGLLAGNRQSARILTLMEEVSLGTRELTAANADGVITGKEAAVMQSDWAKSLIASGEVASQAAKPVNRYNEALEKIRKDPGTGLKIMRGQFQIFMRDLGDFIAPAIADLGGKLTKLLMAFGNASPFFKKFVVGTAAVVAAIGPLRYIFAQMKYTVASFGEVLGKLLPKMNELKGGAAEAMAMLQLNPNRTDIWQQGDAFFMDPGMSRGQKLKKRLGMPLKQSMPPKGATLVTSPNVAANAQQVTANAQASGSNTTRIATEDALENAVKRVSIAEMERTLSGKSVIAANAEVAASNVATTTTLNRSILPVKDLTNKYTNLYNAASGATAPSGKNRSYLDKGRIKGTLDAFKDTAAIKRAEASVASFTSQFAPLFAAAASGTLAIETVGGAAASTIPEVTALEKAYERVCEEFAKLGLEAPAAVAAVLAPAEAAVATVPDISAAIAAWEAYTATLAELGIAAPVVSAELLALGGAAEVAAVEAEVAATGLFATLSALSGGTLVVIVAAIALVMAGLVLIIIQVKKHWKEMYAVMEPAIKKLGAAFSNMGKAFGKVGEAFGKLSGIFSGVIGQLGKGGDGTRSTFEGIASGISMVIDFIAEFVNFLAEGIAKAAAIIMYLKPVIEFIAYIFKDVIGLVASLIMGKWVEALKYLVAVVWEAVRPIAWSAQAIVKAIIWMTSVCIAALGNLAGVFGSNFLSKGLNNAATAVNNWGNSIDIISPIDKKLRTLGGLFGGATKQAAAESTPEAADAGDQIGATISDAAVGALDSGGSSGSVSDWFKDWLSQIKGNLDKQLGELRDSATNALEKAHANAMKIFDERIKAIDDQTKAEQELLKTQEYIANRQELLSKRNFDRQNYLNSRAVAIYEGRFNDVRTLDEEERQSKMQSSKSIEDLDSSRTKDLLANEREAKKESINLEKDAADEKYKIQKEGFDKSLALLTEFAPKTVEEYNKMLTSINSLLMENGVNAWPEMATDGMTRFQKAFDDSSKQIREDFFWSGADMKAEWMRGFAPEDVIAILQQKNAGGGGGGGGASDTGLDLGSGSSELDMPSVDSPSIADKIKAPFVAVFNGLGNFFKKGWFEMLTALLGGFIGSLGGPAGTAFGATVGAIIGRIIHSSFNFVLSYDWGSLFGTIWDVIWGTFEGAIKGIGKLGSMLWDLISGIDYAGIGMSILNGLVSALQFVFITIPTKIGGFLANASSALLDWIKKAVPQIPYYFGFFLGTLVSMTWRIPMLIAAILVKGIPMLVNWIGQAGAFVGEKMAEFGSFLWNAIPDFITKIPGQIAGAAVAMWDWISSAVSMAAGKIAEFSVAAFNGIASFVSSIPGWVAGAATAIWDWIVNAVVNFPQYFMAFWTTVYNGIVSFITNIPGWIAGAADAMWGWLQDAAALAVVKLGEFWQGFQDGLGDVPGKIIALTVEWAPKMWSWITDAVSGLGARLGEFSLALGNFLISLPGEIASRTGELGISLVSWIIDAIPRIPYYMGYFLGFVVRMIITIPFFIAQALATAIPAMVGWIADAASFVAERFGVFVSAIWNAITGFISEIPGYIAGAAEAIWSWLSTAVPMAVQMFIDFELAVFGAIANFIAQIPGWVAGAAIAIWNWIPEAIRNAVGEFVGFELAVLQAIGNFILNIPGYIADAATAMVDWLGNAIPMAVERINAFVVSVANEIANFVTNIPGYIAGAAVAMVNWLGDAIPMAVERIDAFVISVANAIANFVSNIPGWVAGAAVAIWDWLTTAIPMAIERFIAFEMAVYGAVINFIANLPGYIAGAAVAIWSWLVNAIPMAIEAFAAFSVAVFNAIVSFIANIPGWVAGAAVAIWSWLVNAIPMVVERFIEFELAIWGAIVNFITNLPGYIAGAAEAIWGWVSGAVAVAAERIGEFASAVWEGIVNFVAAIPENIADAAHAIWDWIKPAVALVGKYLGDFWQGFKDGLGGMPKQIAEQVEKWIPAVWGWITGAVDGLWDAWWAFEETLYGFIAGAVQGIITAVTEWIPAIFSWLVNAADTLWDTWWAFQETLYGFIGDAIGGIASAVAEWVPAFFSWIVDAIASLPGRLAGIWDTIYGFITGLPGQIASATSGMWNGISDGFLGALNFIIDQWNKFGFTFPTIDVPILGKVGGWVFDTPEIPLIQRKAGGEMYGTGLAGLVNRPQYLVGEGNSRYPEFVIPTDPAYRTRSQALLAQAMSAVGAKGASATNLIGKSYTPTGGGSGGSSMAAGGGDTYITVDTFIGEEQWFAEMAGKYNMKTIPRERKVAGQQKRVISSYNDRWNVK